jgi:hypothetical protein
MLSYFAFDVGSSRLGWRDKVPTLYLKLEKETMEKAMQQLRGTREYAPFIEALSSYERTLLSLLSKFPYGASVDELTALLILDSMGENLRLSSIDTVVSQFDLVKDKRQPTQESIDKILTLGDKYAVRALNVLMADRPAYYVEDQWVSTYFTYSALPPEVNFELGMISGDSGLLSFPFGDPVSSMLNSLFLHKIMKSLEKGDTFRTNSSPSDGSSLKSRFGKVVNASFLRVADGKRWHFAFNLKMKTETSAVKMEAAKALEKMRELQLVREFSIKERVREQNWS